MGWITAGGKTSPSHTEGAVVTVPPGPPLKGVWVGRGNSPPETPNDRSAMVHETQHPSRIMA